MGYPVVVRARSCLCGGSSTDPHFSAVATELGRGRGTMAAPRGQQAGRFLVAVVAAAALLTAPTGVRGDVYLHSLRGSNNRLNEVSKQVNTQQRLFDSQNNANGGYGVGDACLNSCSDGNGNYDATKQVRPKA